MNTKRTDTLSILAAAVAAGSPDSRAALEDCLREGGHERAAVAVQQQRCEVCGHPDHGEPTARGADGQLYTEDQIHHMNSDAGVALFGDDFDWRFKGGPCRLYYWPPAYWWACGACRRRLVALKAAETREKNGAARLAAAIDLFTGVADRKSSEAR